MSQDEKPGIDIRPGGAELVPALALLHAAAFDEPWGEVALGEVLAMPGVFLLQATTLQASGSATSDNFGNISGKDGNRRLSGFVIARMAADEAEILTVAVDISERRQGLGRRLMEAAAARAHALGAVSLFLEVADDNLPAIALYEALGFVAVGLRPGYYARPGAPVAARTMRLDLSKTSVLKRL